MVLNFNNANSKIVDKERQNYIIFLTSYRFNTVLLHPTPKFFCFLSFILLKMLLLHSMDYLDEDPNRALLEEPEGTLLMRSPQEASVVQQHYY